MSTSSRLAARTTRPSGRASRPHSHPAHRSRRRLAVALIACIAAPAALLVIGDNANAADVPGVALRTAANYVVLGASTVTNTGNSTLAGSLGLWPGTEITGFPPGLVLAPGVTDNTNAAAQQAQSDLTAAYLDAAGRPLNATTTADLGNLVLQPGVYAGPSKSALGLTGTLILDGAGSQNSVFIFQTDSSLTTASGSVVQLINGAQECNIFWVVGSSATLGTGSVFVGNILALSSITVTTGVTVRGRALARNAAVTLDTDVFTSPQCAQAAPVTTVAGGATTIPGTTIPGTTIRRIPATGSSEQAQVLVATLLVAVGTGAALIARRRRLIG